MKSIFAQFFKHVNRAVFVVVLTFIMGGLCPSVIGAQEGASSGKTIALPQKDRQELEKYLGPGTIGQPVAAPVIENPVELYGLHPGIWQGKITSGKKGGQDFAWTVETSAGKETSGWRGYRGKRQVDYLEKLDEGHVVVTGVIDNDNGVITRYTPPEPRMRRGIKPGESHTADLEVKVYSVKNPERQKYSGTLNLTLTYMGAYAVKVPAGEYNAPLFKWHYKGKVGPAKIDDAVYRFFAPGVGPVALVEFKHITAALIYRDTEKWGIVLTAYKLD
jgi:hypothetical protein